MAPGMDIHQHCTLLGADGLSDQDLLILTLGADRPPLRRAIAALTLRFPAEAGESAHRGVLGLLTEDVEEQRGLRPGEIGVFIRHRSHELLEGR